MCLTARSAPRSPAPALTLVNGRYKLWSYVSSDTELSDLGPAVAGEWHTAYLYARQDGQVRLWWDGALRFDGAAPLVNPFEGYVEWGSGAWQYGATTTVDFDWVACGPACNLPQRLKASRVGDGILISWPTNAVGFALESTADLFPAHWAVTADPVGVVGWDYAVSNSLSGLSQFFRLRQ